jgi:hypothetical protein
MTCGFWGLCGECFSPLPFRIDERGIPPGIMFSMCEASYKTPQSPQTPQRGRRKKTIHGEGKYVIQFKHNYLVGRGKSD